MSLNDPQAPGSSDRPETLDAPGESVLLPLDATASEPHSLVGQEELLLTLRDSFLEGERVQVLQGPAGIGKTAVALEFARRYRSHYRVILWARARSVETLIADFSALAETLQLPEAQSPYMSMSVGATLTWLANHGDWLLILDDAHDLAQIQTYATFSEKGHVLLTTRAAALDGVGVARTVYRLSGADGATLLLRQAAIHAPTTRAGRGGEATREEAERLVAFLRGHPLALTLAGATIATRDLRLDEYRRLLIQSIEDPSAASLADILSGVIRLSIESLARTSPSALALLRVAAFLHPGEIPEEILREAAGELGIELEWRSEAEDPLTDLLEEAARFGLLRFLPSSEAIDLSDQVLQELRQTSAAEEQADSLGRAIRAVEILFPGAPEGNPSEWTLCNRLLPHGLILAETIERDNVATSDASLLLSVVAYYLDLRGQVAAAEPLYRAALAIEESRLGEDHPDLVTLLNNLALIYEAQNRDADAERLLRRALALKEKAFGLADPSTMATLGNLAYLLQLQGEYQEAKDLLTRALEVQESLHGSHDLSLIPSLESLADLHAAQWDYATAESLCERALAIREKILGNDHPETARSLDKLAELYVAQSKNTAAELFFSRACKIRLKVLPEDHPDLALSYMQLADLFTTLQRYADAESCYARSYAIYSRILGPVHPRTIKVQFNYDSLLLKIGK